MIFKVDNKLIDSNALDRLGIRYKDEGGLKIKSGGRRYYRVETKTAQQILTKKTGGDLRLIEAPETLNLWIEYEQVDKIRNYINSLPFNKMMLNMANTDGDTWKMDRPIKKNMTNREIHHMIEAIKQIINAGTEYRNTDYNIIQIQELPEYDANSDNLFHGNINCVIEAIFKALKDSPKFTKNKQRRLKAYGETIENGATYDDIHTMAKIVDHPIALKDILNNLWKDFIPCLKSNKMKILIMGHSNHAILANDLFGMLYKTTPDSTKKETVFNDKIDIKQHPDAISIKYKVDSREISTVITPTHIYKTPFDECNIYPESWSNGDVGKLKFLEQHPNFSTNIPPIYELQKANQAGFYARTSKSNKDNCKIDQYQAYKSYDYSGCFRGFPASLNQSFNFNDNTRVSDIPELSEMHGLIYLEYEQITPASLKAFTKLYYNGSNYYPIEIVFHYFNKYNVNPIVKQVILSDTAFNVDFSNFTKDQFRCFIGKTTARISKNTLATYGKKELTHLLYKLGDSVIHYNDTPREGEPMTVEYENEAAPWSCYQVGAYVKAHQKVVLYEQINKLLENHIVPVFVGVDGIEITKEDYNKAIELKLINLVDDKKTFGAWKPEQVKLNNFEQVAVIDQNVEYLYAEHPIYKKNEPLDILTHIAGAAGNGKTHMALNLASTHGFKNIVYLCPENDLVATIKAKAKELTGDFIEAYTYHSYAGIHCKSKININHSVFVFEECSKIAPNDFLQIDQNFRKAFNNPQPFGGKRVILVGDFKQLHPVIIQAGEVFNKDDKDPKTIEELPLYKKFTVLTLKKNYRQQEDNAFYKLCNKMRNKETLNDAQKMQIINILNTRVSSSEVINALDLTNIDSIYINGRNDKCDMLNRSPAAQTCKKVINIKKHSTSMGIIPNGAHGTVIEKKRSKDNTTDIFTIEFNGVNHDYYGSYPAEAIKRAYALTVHRVQGRTYSKNVVLDPSTLFAANHLYVAITRAIKMNNLYLTCPITMDIFNRC